MKKILLSCLMAMGIGVSAQFNYVGDFEDDTNLGQYGQFGGGTTTSAGACGGLLGGQTAIGSTGTSGVITQSGWMVMLDVVESELGQTNNGQAATVTFSYKKAANVTGTLYPALFIYDESTNSWAIEYLTSGITLTSGAITTCATLTGTIAAGKMQPGKVYGVGSWFVRSGNTVGNVYTDDISIVQQSVSTVPACTTFTSPTSGGTVAGGVYGFSWATAANAVNYKLTVGTTSGGSNVYNDVVAGTTQNVTLLPNTTYYAKVVPSNTVGDATGCQEITFTTNSQVAHCGPLTTNQPAAVFPISSVTFAGVTKTSSATVGAVTPHEDFTSTVFPVNVGTTSVPLSVSGATNGNPANGWAIAVFIDWNNDGDFTDAGESYFNTTATMVRKAGVADNPVVLTANITVPSGVTPGQKFMRVKYNFSGTAIHTALQTGCSEMGNGQAEDYIIDYKDPSAAVSEANKAKVSVYPNPFHDVLKISDVKGVKSIEVSDVSGRSVKSLAPASELNLRDLKAGLYIVSLKYEDGSVRTLKAIKK